MNKELIPGMNYGVGDLVTCIDSGLYTALLNGSVYEITGYCDKNKTVSLAGIPGGKVWFAKRFKLVGTAAADDYKNPSMEITQKELRTLEAVLNKPTLKKFGPFPKMKEARAYLDQVRLPFLIQTSHLGMRTTICIDTANQLETYKEGILSDRFISELTDVTIEELQEKNNG